MAEVKWIKITTDIFDDEKIRLIEAMPSADSIIVIWFKLLTLAGKQNNNGVFMMGRIAYTDEMLATIFRRDINTVRMALSVFENFGMIAVSNEVYTIPNWEKHQSLDKLEQAQEQTRKRVARHREKQKQLAQGNGAAQCNVTVTLPVTQCNADRIEEDKDKDIDKKKSKENTTTLFERIAAEYALSETLYAKLSEWVKYKAERRESYKEQGMKSLLRQAKNNADKYGETAVCELIEECMANGWKGIIYDRLKQGKPTRKEIVPQWVDKPTDEKARLSAMFPELQQRADALRERLKD